MALGDLGAQVIKVERPGAGDETRQWGPPFAPDGESAYYLSVNRNKLGIALDLDSPSDLAQLEALIRGAHVVVDNYKRGALERHGVDPIRFLTDDPALIWCTITGFGSESDRPGYDYVVQAESGWMSITGEVSGEPTKAGVALADVIAGKDAVIAVLGALASRSPLTIAQRRIFVSLAHSATAALVNVAQNVLVSGQDALRWGNGHPNLVPYQLFHAADRPIVIAVGNDGQWRACCRALQLAELEADERVATNPGRLAHRADVVGKIARRVGERNAAEWLAALDRAGVPCGIVRTVREALQNVSASPQSGVAPAIPGGVRFLPPKLDEHGALIRGHGWTAFDQILGS
jgi:crotonobetainyl-CoA:carnitine CoA-transferase CaiB-like acyl-CoA transferase